jgi:hypothetical protein
MTPIRLLQTAIMPALNELATQGVPMDLKAARFMLAIALQESSLSHRRQVVGGAEAGPAVSYFQMEKNGGCLGVLSHPSTALKMKNICGAYNVSPDPASLWDAMRFQDIVASCAARLLIYSLPRSLPENAEEGWSQYLSAWRPGKPRPAEWENNWAIASKTVGVP